MFSSGEWVKRRLPAIFLLLSLFLPWWVVINQYVVNLRFRRFEPHYFRPFESVGLSFPWADIVYFDFKPSSVSMFCFVAFSHIPFLFSVSALAILGGLFGFSSESKSRALGGILGIGSALFYFMWRSAFPPFELPGNFYFGIGEYDGGGFRSPFQWGGVWFLSVGFCLAAIGSLMLLVSSAGRPSSLFSFVRVRLERLKETIFSGIRWTKRQLPTVFLLASLVLPWSTIFRLSNPNVMFFSGRVERVFHEIELSFPWEDVVEVLIGSAGLQTRFVVEFHLIPYVVFVSVLVVVAGLCGLSSKDEIRALGGLLGIMSVVSYSILILPKSVPSVVLKEFGNPFFGTYHPEEIATDMLVWFISPGFYLAIIGSAMLLLLPMIRVFAERLAKPP